MEEKIPLFFEGLKARKVNVIGLGVTNNDLIRMMLRKGIAVTVFDRKTRPEVGALADELEALGGVMVLGPDAMEHLDGDVIFRAPGVYFHRPELEAARAQGRVVTSELEVFFDLCPCPIIAVTGSDGKTTTTTLIAEMLRAQGYTVHLGGNIGRALLPQVESIRPGDWAVVELSSFQLISMRRGPRVAVVTNVSPNHLDVHKDMEEYIDAKKNILLHQDGFSKTVLGADNAVTLSFASLVRGDLNTFSRREKVERGAWMDGDKVLWYSDGQERTRLMEASQIRIPGLHNVENMLAAVSAVWGIVSLEAIRKVAGEFGGVEHRIEFVRELDGVRWYNDSIATSPTRTMAGLRSFDQKLIIIAGGYDKQIPFEPLAPVLVERVKLLILTGKTAGKIEAAVTADPGFGDSGLRILRAADLAQAVEIARREAKEGDVVSLSPACASFDAYPNFEARGRHFKELVRGLQ